MKIFISYKSQNRDFANLLRDTLHSWGHETWMDVHAIPPGAASWSDEIQKGLEWADITIGLMTEIALRSENVKNEWNWTITNRQKYGKRLILLRLEDCDVPMHYISSNWIDIASMGQTAGLNLLQNWLANPNKNIADSTPVAPDPYQTYLEALYDELVEELDFLVLSVERMMDIRGHSTRQQVEGQRRMLRSFSMRRAQEDVETPITSFEEGFQKYKGRLLLLGEPGAGKTITLLTTARDAVLKRLQDPKAPLPLIGRIATWDASQQTPLHKWLAEYTSLDASIVQQVIITGNCFLLLDGLDELGGMITIRGQSFDPKQRFVNLVNQIPNRNHVLVTSRKTEYEQISEKLHLNGAVTLDTLSNEQISDYLGLDTATQQLWTILKSHVDLLDVARNPLLLSLFAFAFRDLPEQGLMLQNPDFSQAEIRNAIFKQYIQRRFNHEAERYQLRSETPPYSLDELYEILGYIAMINAGGYWRENRLSFDNPPITDNILFVSDFELAMGTDNSDKIVEFIRFANQLHLITQQKDQGIYRFIHLFLRDYLVHSFCLPKLTDLEWYPNSIFYASPVQALAKIADIDILSKLTGILWIRTKYDPIIIRHLIRGLHNSRFVRNLDTPFRAKLESEINAAMQVFVGNLVLGSLGGMSGGLSGRPDKFSFKYLTKTIEENVSADAVNEAFSVLKELVRRNDNRVIEFLFQRLGSGASGMYAMQILDEFELPSTIEDIRKWYEENKFDP
jgi:hypothetical protein